MIRALVGTFVETEREVTTPNGTVVPAGAVGEVVGEAWGYLNVTWPGLDDSTMLRPSQLRPSSRAAWEAWGRRAIRRGPWVPLRTERREGLLVIPAQRAVLLEGVADGGFLRVDFEMAPGLEWLDGALRAALSYEMEATGDVMVTQDVVFAVGWGSVEPVRPGVPVAFRAAVGRELTVVFPAWESDPGAVSVRLRATWQPTGV